MKNLNYLNGFRISLQGFMGDGYNGVFSISLYGYDLRVIASSGGEWEHVSVSTYRRPPPWRVMSEIKDMFFKDDEVVMQLHPSKENYKNIHPNCLHLWRPLRKKIPLPPLCFV